MVFVFHLTDHSWRQYAVLGIES